MPTNAKTKEKKAAERKTRRGQPKQERQNSEPAAMSALDLLEQDHRQVEELFDEFDELENDKQKQELARKICMMLTVHAQIEEEIFYPEVRKATKDDDLIDEALVEHASAKRLVEEVERTKAGDDMFDARMKVLEEQMKHHIKEEEEELFPEVIDAKMDLDAVGQRLGKRKAELMKKLEHA